ncbi:MAG: MoaD/ThiS family protein [Deltaproteobacteria bacterium]|nr:MoaD/ThiS family protein [Deltaproteobacteria bacterium]
MCNGFRSYVFIPSSIEQSKVVGTTVYGSQVVAVEDPYDDVNRPYSEIASSYPWGFVNIYLNNEDIRFLDKEKTPVRDGDQVSIIPAIAGGASLLLPG